MTVKIAFLYEHASGYAIMRAKAANATELTSKLSNLPKHFDSMQEHFKLAAFSPFTSAVNALENCNSISEGLVHDDLNQFLTEHLSSVKATVLYVAERKLADAIRSEISLPDNLAVQFDSAAVDVFRCIRVIFPGFISELSHFAESKAQIGLGHSYSRAKVKFNVNRADNMIIQTISLLDQMDKDINTFSMRIKEWFSYHFPELVKIVPDNPTFVQVVGIMKSREGLDQEALDKIAELLDDAEKANLIADVARTSVGFEISEEDVENLTSFTQRIVLLIQRRKATYDYLLRKMEGVAPNLSTLIGDQVAARLIAHAGSLTNLAKFPASTVQILGAEKALFRALKTRSNTPKYGIIFHSSFIGRAARENKGKISRFLAAKCAIASRIDCFSDILCDVYGKHLHQQVEDRLAYFISGDRPKDNREVMAVAVDEAEKVIRKIKKRALKTLRMSDAKAYAEENGLKVEPNGTLSPVEGENGVDETLKKKKKAKKRTSEAVVEDEDKAIKQEEDSQAMKEEEPTEPTPKKKKKKMKIKG